MTWSPGLKPSTPAPVSLTTPASSLPGENGRGGLNWYLFWMMRTSGKLTLAALTESTTSPGPARGEGRSSTTSESGGPNCLQTTAFINIECHNARADPASLPGFAFRREDPHHPRLQEARLALGRDPDGPAQARRARAHRRLSAHAAPADRRRRLLRHGADRAHARAHRARAVDLSAGRNARRAGRRLLRRQRAVH